MIAEAGAAISSIKVAMDIAKGVASLKTATEINQAVIEIQRSLLDAQSAAFEDKQIILELANKLASVEGKLEKKKDWEEERARYALTCSELGAFTYNLIPEHANGQVYHRLCATCFEEGKKSILQTVLARNGGELVECQSCKNRLQLTEFNDPPIQTTGSYF